MVRRVALPADSELNLVFGELQNPQVQHQKSPELIERVVNLVVL